MATHDYTIANQTFPSTRSDINNVLSAIVSNNSSATEPSTTYAYMWWYDTTTTTLKFRNRDNDAWVGFASFDMDNDTVNFLDSTVTITGLTTTATGTVFTLSDTDNKSSVDFIIDNEKKLILRESSGNGTNYVALKAPASLASDVTFTLPNADGTADQILKTDGSGNLSFVDATVVIDWCTTAKTAPFTGVSGKAYFINTTCGAVTVTLPASPTAGDFIGFKDYAGQWNTNAVTLCNNGNKINGVCATASLSTQNQSITLIYVDATKGWQDINDSTSSVTGGGFITATGGTISCCGDYKIHKFTSDGTFCVSAGGGSLAVVDYLVVAGGGSGGTRYGGGGGGGGYRESHCATVSGCYTASPLATPIGLQMSIGAYPITVGGGGAGVSCTTGDNPGNRGSSSVFSTITSTGGGGGQGQAPGTNPNIPGGSGGGGSYEPGIFGAGNTPPVSPPQGNPGGTGNPGGATSPYSSGGGGGAGAAASAAPGCASGTGGAGVTTSISGSPTAYAGGGGGGATDQGATSAPGGSGGGTAGGSSSGSTTTAGTANTGGGSGGGYGAPGNSGAGGSGIVIIRYKFQ